VKCGSQAAKTGNCDDNGFIFGHTVDCRVLCRHNVIQENTERRIKSNAFSVYLTTLFFLSTVRRGVVNHESEKKKCKRKELLHISGTLRHSPRINE